MNNNIDIELITRYITEECSQEEYKIIQTWINKDSKNAQIYRDLKKVWTITGDLKLEQDESKAYKKIYEKIFGHADTTLALRLNSYQKQKSKKYDKTNSDYASLFNNSFFRIAVAILIIVGLSWFFYSYSSNVGDSSQRIIQKIATGPGQHARIMLSDGSKVILNASSTIRFPNHFGREVRSVKLKGEAYFIVNHNANIPFVIHTDKGIIRDLGTRFDVRAYPQDNNMAVVVAEGKVGVYSNHSTLGDKQKLDTSNTSKVTLTKGQMTHVIKGGIPSIPEAVNPKHYIGWTKGKLIFDSTPLRMVLKKLNHYYSKHFAITDSSLLDRRLTATFTKESFTKVLDVITLTMDMSYERKTDEGNTFILKPNDEE